MFAGDSAEVANEEPPALRSEFPSELGVMAPEEDVRW